LQNKEMKAPLDKLRPFYQRGIAYFDKQDYTRAVADFNEDIRRHPEDSVPTYMNRGRIQFYKGDYAAAIADLRESLKTGPTNDKNYPYRLLWLYMAQTRAHEAAIPELSTRSKKLTSQQWPYAVIDFYLGNMAALALLALASNSDERCEAQFYVAEWHLMRGEKEAAVDLFKAAKDGCRKTFIEYEGAVAALTKLGR
jgi:lipoprotein NlpI